MYSSRMHFTNVTILQFVAVPKACSLLISPLLVLLIPAFFHLNCAVLLGFALAFLFGLGRFQRCASIHMRFRGLLSQNLLSLGLSVCRAVFDQLVVHNNAEEAIDGRT